MSPAITRIIAETAEAYGLSSADLLSERRLDRAIWARQVAMWLARECTPASLTMIGTRFRRDHSTVLHAHRRVECGREADPEIRAETDTLRTRLSAETTAEVERPSILALAMALIAKPASDRALSGQQIGLICHEIIRLNQQQGA